MRKGFVREKYARAHTSEHHYSHAGTSIAPSVNAELELSSCWHTTQDLQQELDATLKQRYSSIEHGTESVPVLDAGHAE